MVEVKRPSRGVRVAARRGRVVMGTLRTLGECEVLISPQYVETRFPDGTFVPAVAEANAGYEQTARSLGYGADTARMNREHDALHTWLASKLGLLHSPVLWAVAHGTLEQGDFGAEERLVMDFQRLLNGALLPKAAPSPVPTDDPPASSTAVPADARTPRLSPPLTPGLTPLRAARTTLDELCAEARQLLDEIHAEIAVLEPDPPR